MKGLQRLKQTKSSSASLTPLSEAAVKSPEQPLLQLQATIGNRAVNQWIAAQQTTSGTRQPIQAKPMFQGLAQELVGQSRQGEELIPTPIPSALTISTSGKPIPPAVQEKMERAFGTDFSDVRIHEGPEAVAIGALAYTRGSHIHFAPGQYDPINPSGQHLLGHELTHVVQQRLGLVKTTVSGATPLNNDSQLEIEANTLGVQAARGAQSLIKSPPNSCSSQNASPNSPIQRMRTPKIVKNVLGIGREAKLRKSINMWKKLSALRNEMKQLEGHSEQIETLNHLMREYSTIISGYMTNIASDSGGISEELRAYLEKEGISHWLPG